MCNLITNTVQLPHLPAIQASTKRPSLTQEEQFHLPKTEWNCIVFFVLFAKDYVSYNYE